MKTSPNFHRQLKYTLILMIFEKNVINLVLCLLPHEPIPANGNSSSEHSSMCGWRKKRTMSLVDFLPFQMKFYLDSLVSKVVVLNYTCTQYFAGTLYASVNIIILVYHDDCFSGYI